MLENNDTNLRHWVRFIIFTIILSLIVGFFSVVSDNLPYIDNGITVTQFLISYIAVMINSLPMWFILATIVGCMFGRTSKEATFVGALYTIFAISFYFLLGNFYLNAHITFTFKEQISIFIIWYGASLAGGIIGGLTGYLVKTRPYILLIIPVGLIFQLFLNGTRSWNDIIGISQNITFCLMILSILIYLLMIKAKKLK
ncbi:hypothetical protein CN918_28210 [Priestia megaterium]|nr:hypothetical protein CN918_28210 [Priestia megaterium]